MITVSIGHSPVVENQDLSGGDLGKKMTKSRCRNIGDQELAIIKFLLYSRTALTKRKGMSGMNGWKTYTDKKSKCQQTLQLGRKGGKHRSRRCAKAPLIHRNRGVFELLNESNGTLTPALRHLLLKDCIQILKRSNPDRTVIIGLTNWNYISIELDELVLLDEKLF